MLRQGHRDVHDHGRHLHPEMPVLRCRPWPAVAPGQRGAVASGGDDCGPEAGVRRHHQRGSRRPSRRRRRPLQGLHWQGARNLAGNADRSAGSGFPRPTGARLVGSCGMPARCDESQSRNRAQTLPAGAAGLRLRAFAQPAAGIQAPLRGRTHQVRVDGWPRRNRRGDPRGDAGHARSRHRYVDDRPVPAAHRGPSSGDALRPSGNLRAVRARGLRGRISPCRRRRAGALVVSRRSTGTRRARDDRMSDRRRRPTSMGRRAARAIATVVLLTLVAGARAEVSEVRISHGYGVLYLPLMIMASEKLLEKHAKAAGLGEVKATYLVLDGGNVINDAMLSGSLDIASIGVAGFLTLWAKARDNPALEIRGLSGLSSSSVYLMTRNPKVRSLKDFTDQDRIAVPGIKSSLPAVLLHMVAAAELGEANYAKLDTITVALPHPDALTVMLSGKSEINSHMASPPFSYIEDATPGVHRVLSTVDILGNITLDMTYTSRRFFEANPKLCAAFIAALNEADALIA